MINEVLRILLEKKYSKLLKTNTQYINIVNTICHLSKRVGC